MKVFCTTIAGTANVQSAVCTLVAKSQWFELTPLPDDCYKITVKSENKELLQRMASTYREFVAGLPLESALWWFIENIAKDDPERNVIHSDLRTRMRTRKKERQVDTLPAKTGAKPVTQK